MKLPLETVVVPMPGRAYSVDIGHQARRQLGERRRELSADRRPVVIADRHVADLHLDRLLAELPDESVVITVPPGERSKSLEQAAAIYDALAEKRVERDDLIITFGGGVVGDLGGFVAATWLRGVRYLQVPTTLEAAIDASVGGKTAVDHAAGKNLIGAFHQPVGVIVDTEFLETLPDRDFVAGLAESVKHAAIRDAEFLGWHEDNAGRINAREAVIVTELIACNCRIKAAVVAADERESGLRAILNYGHTIGHAIEHLLDYALRHGECVGLGMIVENELACERGLQPRGVAERLRNLLAALGLPTRLPQSIDPVELAAATRMDKKSRGGAVNFVLLQEVGDPRRCADISPDEIAAALAPIQPDRNA